MQDAFKQFSVVLLLGPRQCGKTTLARQILESREGAYFDLEDPATPLKPELAKTVLKDLKGLMVIDEFQRLSGTFPTAESPCRPQTITCEISYTWKRLPGHSPSFDLEAFDRCPMQIAVTFLHLLMPHGSSNCAFWRQEPGKQP